jgi:hypothetical protein
MAKKGKEKLKEGLKKIYHEYKDKAISTFGEFLEEQAGNIVAWAKDITRIKKIIRKCFISTILAIGAVSVILIGAANLLEMYFQGIALGWWQVIVGLIALLGVSIYMKK